MALMQNARMRFLAIIAIDLTMAASSLVFAVSLRVSGALESAVVQGLWVAATPFALIAFGVFNTIGIYRRMWPYSSFAAILMVCSGVTLSLCFPPISLLVAGRQDGLPGPIPLPPGVRTVGVVCGG